MKKLILIFFILTIFKQSNAQELDLTFKQHVDSLKLWEYSFAKNEDGDGDGKIGALILKRKQDIYSSDNTKVLSPSITFNVYPVSVLDSISNLESKRALMISCCYPICGATIKATKNFVFWSSPWSITSALDCGGIDFTRKNATLIINSISDKEYNSIDELLKDLPIEQTKN